MSTEETGNSTSAPAYRTMWLLMLLALAVRGATLLIWSDDLTADPDGYRGIAELLIETGEYRRPIDFELHNSAEKSIVTAYRPPLYPLLLAALAGILGSSGPLVVGFLHAGLGVATVALTYWLAVRWLPAESAKLGSLLAATLVMLDPILLRQASLVMTETLATFLATLSLAALTCYASKPSHRTALWAGYTIGLACLCRPTFLPWAALVAAAMLLLTMPRNAPSSGISTRSLAFPLAFALAVGAMLAPWIIRNQIRFERPIVATTHGGYTLLLGNNPEFYAYLADADGPELWDAEGSQMGAEYRQVERAANGNEIAVDQWASARARVAMAQQPTAFAWASVVRLGRFWQLMPHRTQRSESTGRFFMRLAIGVWYGLLLLLALVGCYSLRTRIFHSPWLWALLLVASLTLVHTIYWSNMRMRAPIMPVLALLAAVGVGKLRATTWAQ